jgi:hypothetical protein
LALPTLTDSVNAPSINDHFYGTCIVGGLIIACLLCLIFNCTLNSTPAVQMNTILIESKSKNVCCEGDSGTYATAGWCSWWRLIPNSPIFVALVKQL